MVHLCRALPGLNSAGVGLIVASVFQLGLKIRTLSPFPEASVCIGELPAWSDKLALRAEGSWSGQLIGLPRCRQCLPGLA